MQGKKVGTRKNRLRKKLRIRSSRLRLSVFVSGRHIYAQVIDDQKGATLVAVKEKDLDMQGKGIEVAKKVGELVGKKAKQKGVDKVVFDRGDRRYHGRIKSLADGARSAGLEF
tara:strand:+ start:157 stop:495 length:339 start_codon:yes stop_codon:yes gene_type:complete